FKGYTPLEPGPYPDDKARAKAMKARAKEIREAKAREAMEGSRRSSRASKGYMGPWGGDSDEEEQFPLLHGGGGMVSPRKRKRGEVETRAEVAAGDRVVLGIRVSKRQLAQANTSPGASRTDDLSRRDKKRQLIIRGPKPEALPAAAKRKAGAAVGVG
ncbi:unnamed protein product, partial [Discosporangium mesarthrocarpum]